MKISVAAATAASLFCWAFGGTTSAVAQAYYYYYGAPFNAWVRLPLAGEPRPFIPWGSAYYGDSFCYPSVGVCCPSGFKLVHTEQRQLARVTKYVCTPIG